VSASAEIDSEEIRGIRAKVEGLRVDVDGLADKVDELTSCQIEGRHDRELMRQEISSGFRRLEERDDERKEQISKALTMEQEKRERKFKDEREWARLWVKILGGVLTAMVTAVGAYFMFRAKGA